MARHQVEWDGACPGARAEGPGTVSDGSAAFVARFHDGHPDGPVRLDEGGRTVFTGTFAAQGAEGRGTTFLPDGTTGTFDYHEGRPLALVTLIWPNGARIDGNFTPDGRTGSGTVIRPNGERYEGTVKDTLYEGKGSLLYPSGARFTGTFHNGKRDGAGIMVSPRGETTEGIWTADALNGHVLTRAPDGNIVNDTEWRNGHMISGSYRFPDGARYVGSWLNGFPDGQGTLTQPDGTRFAGLWHHGCFDDGTRQIAKGLTPATCP